MFSGFLQTQTLISRRSLVHLCMCRTIMLMTLRPMYCTVLLHCTELYRFVHVLYSCYTRSTNLSETDKETERRHGTETDHIAWQCYCAPLNTTNHFLKHWRYPEQPFGISKIVKLRWYYDFETRQLTLYLNCNILFYVLNSQNCLQEKFIAQNDKTISIES